jgi:putative zinc finger/helix-turn-helix YgiT family protein
VTEMDESMGRVCYSCGGKAELVVGPVLMRFRDHEVTVPNVEHERCGTCGEELFNDEQGEALQRAAADIVRASQGLLTSEMIRSWRARVGMTQEDLESALGVGAKTVTRWERGLVFPSATADRLMRVAMRFPKVLRILRAGDLYSDAVAGTTMSFNRIAAASCLDGLDVLTQGFVPAATKQPLSVERREVSRDAVAA